MATLYLSYFEKRYTHRLCTCSFFFILLLFLLTLVIPYILVFITNGMWLKQNHYYEKPDVAFRNELVIEVWDGESSNMFSTVKRINQQSMNEMGVPLVKMTKIDDDGDGVNEAVHLQVTLQK